jgi:hypothetical protein
MPHIGVNKPIELNSMIKRNLFNYLKNYDWLSLVKYKVYCY